MRRITLSAGVLACAIAALAACSSGQDPSSSAKVAPGVSSAAQPADPTLGSPGWYAWVDQSLGITPGHGDPQPGTDAWNVEVQRRLGEEAPRAKLGSPQWQSAVDALLRTRNSEQAVHSMH